MYVCNEVVLGLWCRRILGLMGAGSRQEVVVARRCGSPGLGVFSLDSGHPLTRGVTTSINIRLKALSSSRFDSNRVGVGVSRDVHNYRICIVRSADSPMGSRLVRLLVVVSTLGHTDTGAVGVILPCCNCTHRSHGTRSHRPVATGLITGVVAGTNTSELLALSVRTPRVRNFFSVPISRLLKTPLLTDCFLSRRILRSSMIIISPSRNNIAETHGLTRFVGTPVTVVSGEEPGTGITRIVGVVNGIRNGGYVLVSSVVSATNAVALTTRTLRSTNTLSICTYYARTMLSNPTVSHVGGSMVGRLVIASSVGVPTRGIDSGVMVISISRLVTRTVGHVRRGHSMDPLFRRGFIVVSWRYSY